MPVAGFLLGSVLVAYGFLATIPIAARWLPVTNVLVAAALVVVARARGYSWKDLGLAPAALRAGLRWGVAGLLAMVAVIVVVFLVYPGAFRCGAPRVVGLGVGGLLLQALVRAPLATAAAEEVMFRGVLSGVFSRRGAMLAAVWSSLFFALWHLGPTLATLKQAAGIEGCPTAVVPALVGAVVFTFAGGLALWFLCSKSGGILAPVLVHAAYDSAGFIAVYGTVNWS
jgi:uncharacterized protein